MQHKQFGLRAIITYADNTTEKHYVPFNPDLTDWQFTSLAIVPKRDDAVIKTIRVVCAFERNVNEAFFDNGNLTKLTRAEAVSICWHGMGMMTMTAWKLLHSASPV